MEVLQVSNVDYVDYNQNVCDYEVYLNEYDESEEYTVNALAKKLERELRAAKYTHLSCGEVLLPTGMLENIARAILDSADTELYGLRGCTINLCFEGIDECRKLSSIKCDPSTVSTFELNLTLKGTPWGWNAFLPQFIKKMSGGITLMMNPVFTLTKNRLYRSYK